MDRFDVDSTVTPPRRTDSIRRTATIDMTWPEGAGSTLRFDLRGRDLYTGAHAPTVLHAERFSVEVTNDLNIVDAHHAPSVVRGLTGRSVRHGFRRALREATAPPPAGDLAHALLDDLPPASIISDFAWRQWVHRAPHLQPLIDERGGRDVTGMCAGFAPGSSALNPDGTSTGGHRTRRVGPLPRPDDPDGWHTMPEGDAMSTRRARRVDLWREDDRVLVDAALQDSATRPEGGRVAVHEYRISMVLDANLMISSVSATWANLPYAECPAASGNVDRLVGTPVGELRAVTTRLLPGPLGCTHLTDALRNLADVATLAGHFRAGDT